MWMCPEVCIASKHPLQKYTPWPTYVPALPSPFSLVLCAKTTSTLLNISLLISDDGSSFLLAVVPSGIGSDWGTWTMGALVVAHVSGPRS